MDTLMRNVTRQTIQTSILRKGLPGSKSVLTLVSYIAIHNNNSIHESHLLLTIAHVNYFIISCCI